MSKSVSKRRGNLISGAKSRPLPDKSRSKDRATSKMQQKRHTTKCSLGRYDAVSGSGKRRKKAHLTELEQTKSGDQGTLGTEAAKTRLRKPSADLAVVERHGFDEVIHPEAPRVRQLHGRLVELRPQGAVLPGHVPGQKAGSAGSDYNARTALKPCLSHRPRQTRAYFGCRGRPRVTSTKAPKRGRCALRARGRNDEASLPEPGLGGAVPSQTRQTTSPHSFDPLANGATWHGDCHQTYFACNLLSLLG